MNMRDKNTSEILSYESDLDALIRSHREELQRLRELSYSLSGNGTSQNASRESHDAPYVNIVNKIITFEKQIEREINELIDLKIKIHNAIGSIKDTTEKLVLRYKYIEKKSEEEIAEIMSYSPKQIGRIHSDALRKLKL